MRSIKSLWKINYWIVFIASWAIGSPITQEQVPSEVQRVIDSTMKGANHSLLVNFDQNKEGWGFNKTTKLSDVQPGKPFRVYTIQIDSLKKMDENTPVSLTIIPQDVWLVPLLENGEIISLFEITKNANFNGRSYVRGQD